ncbi:hypothetical protein V6N11_018191 [Hibiscus sabdariffa]|uniref:Uncharacterized protein n=1 Tax=Hibiscus sabdariffa TaxID=183260 RepID=A0ABR2T7A5_9ROSI
METTTTSIKMTVEGDNNKFSRGLQGKAENSSIRSPSELGKNDFITGKETITVMVGDEYKNHEKGAKRVLGHVDEDLWKMKRCLVGEMSTVFGVTFIMERLKMMNEG